VHVFKVERVLRGKLKSATISCDSSAGRKSPGRQLVGVAYETSAYQQQSDQQAFHEPWQSRHNGDLSPMRRFNLPVFP
jgi:hypothetical protein